MAPAESDLFSKFGQHIEAGKVIFREGEEGDQMYIIQEGRVKVSRLIAGKEQVLAILGKGDFFGEMALVTREKRTASVSALEPVMLLAFNREGFLNMINKNAKIALNIIEKLCRRLANANLHLRHWARKDARGLIAMNLRFAFQGAGKGAATLAYDRTVAEFSQNLELALDQVQAVLEELQRGGILRIEANAIALEDAAKLDSLSEHLGG